MSGSVIGAVVVSSMLSVTTAILAVGSGLVQRQHLHSAADLAALAAADALFGFAQTAPCEAAELIANAHHVNLTDCSIEVTSVTVGVEQQILGATHSASARAGIEPTSETG